jgi:hypothetical protein
LLENAVKALVRLQLDHSRVVTPKANTQLLLDTVLVNVFKTGTRSQLDTLPVKALEPN